MSVNVGQCQSISDNVGHCQTKRLSNAAAATKARQQTSTGGDRTGQPPHVFLTDGTDDEPALMDIIHKFTLNEAQQRVFRIIAYHTLGRSKVGPQLRLGVFGEGGTGKSRLMAAVRAWFAALNRQNELVVTAPTGTAAFNVVGITIHSAGNLPIRKQKKKKMGSKTKHWKDHQYLIIDEVNMMDSKMLVNLNTNLKEAKIPIDVRCYTLRDALNKERLQIASQVSDVPITHCLADIKTRIKMSRS
jgi:hypothetical protein